MIASPCQVSCSSNLTQRFNMAFTLRTASARANHLLKPHVTCCKPPGSSATRASRSTCVVRGLADTASSSSSQAGMKDQTVKPSTLAGRIDVIFGPMFAGKSSELLRRVKALEAANKKVALVKSDRDTRYSKNEITTHDGLARPCHAVGSLAELRATVGEEYANIEVIAIDEAQFFPDLLSFCTEASDHDQKQIVVAGLDGDFQRHRFGQVLDLIPVSDSVTKLSADCAYCGKAALFSLRIAADQRQEVVGGADKYAPVCRHHYVSLSVLRRHQ